MTLTPEDIKNKQFTTTRGFGEGYVETEVDDFLDEVYEEFTRLLAGQGNGHAASDFASPAATAVPPPQPVVTVPGDDRDDREHRGGRDDRDSWDAPAGTAPGVSGPATMSQSPIEAATGILALAQRTAEEHVAAAQEEAEELRSSARRQAEELKRAAEQQRRDELGALEAEHSQLERTIDSLRTFEREYRSRLRAYLDAQLHELDAAQLPEPDGARRFLLDEGRNT
jgi:DivIVA domain-containing protein